MELWVLHPSKTKQRLAVQAENHEISPWSTLWESLVGKKHCLLWHLNSKVDGRYYSVSNYKFKYTLWSKNNDFRFLTLPPEIRENMSYNIPTLGLLGYKMYYKGTVFIVCLVTSNISVSLSWLESACFWKSYIISLTTSFFKGFFLAWPTVVLYSRLMHFKIPCGLAQILFNRKVL